MKQLLRMIDQVKRQHSIPVMKKDNDGQLDFHDDAMKTELFWKYVDAVVPFVFQRGPDPTSEAPEVELDELLDSPFSIFSIEMLGDLPLSEARPDDILEARVFCILIVEEQDKHGKTMYLPFNLIETTRPTTGEKANIVAISMYTLPLVKAYLQKLNTGELGTEFSRNRIRIGTGQSKRTVTIRKIVHVRSKGKKSIQDLESSGTKIDWSHRWVVRGHWRKHEGLGKNREGVYCVDGRTWVNSFEKGPEHAPLVKKLRLVETK